MFFIASIFQLPPVSERFHGNYRQPQQSGSHRSDHKVTPADSLHLQPASSRSENTCLPQRPEFWSFAVYWLLRVTQVSCFSLDSRFSSICSVCVCFDCQWLHTPFRQRPDYQHTTPSVWASPESQTLLLYCTVIVMLGILVLLVIYCPAIVFQHLRGHGGSLLTKLI